MGTVLSTLAVVTLLSITQPSEVVVIISINPAGHGKLSHGVLQ